MTAMRRAERGQLLEDRRRQIHQNVQSQIRHERAGRPIDVGDVGESSEAGSREDIDLALLQRKAEAPGRLEETLGRIDAGEYEDCLECHIEIPEPQSSARILDRFLKLLPTVTIPEGQRIKVHLSDDLALPAYRDDPPSRGCATTPPGHGVTAPDTPRDHCGRSSSSA